MDIVYARTIYYNTFGRIAILASISVTIPICIPFTAYWATHGISVIFSNIVRKNINWRFFILYDSLCAVRWHHATFYNGYLRFGPVSPILVPFYQCSHLRASWANLWHLSRNCNDAICCFKIYIRF
jgi:hypothetical protein